MNGKYCKEIAELMNEKFNINISDKQVRSKIRNSKLYAGAGRGFTKANNCRALPVGSEATTRGYVKVKIAEPNVWEYKHRLIWEEANGKIPRGYNLIFADGNSSNIRLDNLLLANNKEMIIMNRFGLRYENKELTATGLNVARLILKISESKKRN